MEEIQITLIFDSKLDVITSNHYFVLDLMNI